MYPRRKALFDAWYKAMVAGATVDKPNYGKTTRLKKKTGKRRSRRTQTRRRRIRHAKKEG